MAGFFSAFGTSANAVSDDPFAVEANTYNVVVTSADLKTFKEIPYFMVELTIDGGKEAGKKASAMHRMIPWTPQERAQQGDFEAMNARLLSGFKVDMLNFGIKPEVLDQFDPSNPAHRNSLLGIKGTAFVSTKNGYTNYKDFKRAVAAAPVENNTAATSTEMQGAPDQSAIDALMGDF